VKDSELITAAKKAASDFATAKDNAGKEKAKDEAFAIMNIANSLGSHAMVFLASTFGGGGTAKEIRAARAVLKEMHKVCEITRLVLDAKKTAV
jgi:hypothetical protein